MPRSPKSYAALAGGGLLLAVIASGCATEADDGATDVDQPSPVDWRSQNALMTAPAKSPRTIAAMMFDIGNGAPNATSIMSVIGGTGSSQRHMFQEISYGIQDTQPEYFGPYTLPVRNCLTIACCGPSSDNTGNGDTVQMHMDSLGKTFNHYFWVYGGIPSGANLRAPGATRARRAASRSTRATRSTRSSATRRRLATTSA